LTYKENGMLGQIIFNTPPWVWALLAFLIYRGMRAAADREIPFRRIFIIPLVMLGLSLHGIGSTFGIGFMVLLTWLATTLVASGLSWHLPDYRKMVAHPARGTLFLPGSWTPLLMMLGIFFIKYVVAVMLSMNPHYAQTTGFAIAICALYGLFNGIFIGHLLRLVSIYRQAGSALRALSGKSSGEWASQKI
jgi:hypothetical protein